MTEIVFELRKQFGNSLSSRNSIDKLFCQLNESACVNKAILDFEGVDFISRASADQLIKIRNDIFQKKNIVVEFRNLNTDSYKMIQVVAGTQNKRDRTKNLLPVYNITNFEFLEKLLLNI